MIISKKIVKARKPYKCELSGNNIIVGEKYVIVSQKVENNFYSIKVCFDAWKLVMEMWDAASNAINECLDEKTYKWLKYGE